MIDKIEEKCCPFEYMGQCTLDSDGNNRPICMGVEFCKNQIVYK